MMRELNRARKSGDWLMPPTAADHPRTWGECAGGPRPCPLVGCRHHLYLEVDPANGSIKVNRPDVPVWEMERSCTLDEAQRGGMTLEEVSEVLGVTRERIRQLENRAMRRLAELIGSDPEAPDAELRASFAQNRPVNPDDVFAALGLNKEDSWLKNLLHSHLSTNQDSEPWLTSMTDLG
jgi:hypothetical protein